MMTRRGLSLTLLLTLGAAPSHNLWFGVGNGPAYLTDNVNCALAPRPSTVGSR